MTQALARADDELVGILRELPTLPLASWPDVLRDIDLPRVAPALRFDAESYARSALAETESAQILVMGWLPGQASAIHDHGAAKGVARVLAGRCVEETFVVRPDGTARKKGSRWRSAPDWLEEPEGVVHRLRNPGPHMLVTLHAFAPKPEGWRKYDEAPIARRRGTAPT